MLTELPEGDEQVVRFDDVESSEAKVGEAFYPHSVAVHGRGRSFSGTFSLARLGPVVMGEMDYNTGLTLTCPRVRGYHLNMALHGGMWSTSNGREVLSSVGKAALYGDDSDALLRTSSDARFSMLAVHIEQRPLENALAALLGRPVTEPLRLAPGIDLGTGAGREWFELLAMWRTLRRKNVLLANPMVAEPLGQSILTGLLFAAEHQFSDRIRTVRDTATPLVARRAEEYIMGHIGEPLTVAEVARAVGASTRAVQREFHEHFGMSPKELIRARRLERAHADLATKDPATTTVTQVAMRWGFAHLGRFSRDYRQVYGVSPVQTLRS